MAQTVFAPIDTPLRAADKFQLPVAAAIHLYPGILIARDGAGRATFAGDTAGTVVVGRCEDDVDNTAGSAGALNVNVVRGCFKYSNSVAHALTPALFGTICFVENEQTVSSNGGTNSIKAGLFLGLDTDGRAWVDTRITSI